MTAASGSAELVAGRQLLQKGIIPLSVKTVWLLTKVI